MSALFHQLDRKARRILVAGNLSLALALVLWNFTRYFSARYPWYDGVCGFFFGISIGLNLFGLWFARGCRRSQA
jgi:hypothetical protein